MTESLAGLSLRAQLALVGAPVFWWQGRQVRRHTPQLPEAPGLRQGRIEGRQPALNLIGLGESPLAGVGVDTPAHTVTARLAAELAEARQCAVTWSIHARGGITVAGAIRELVPAIPSEPADLVLIGLGVNDCLRLRSAGRWRREMTELLDLLDERVRPRGVVLAGVPPMNYFPALPQPLAGMLGLRARLLDAASARLAAQRDHLVHVPMRVESDAATLFCHDGFHPSAAGHRRWARQLAPIAIEHLDRSDLRPGPGPNSDPAG